jgi:hypothetical protein
LPKVNKKVHQLSELGVINYKLNSLKALADKELISIYGLTGMVYTPHIDEYMQVCLERANILASLKQQKILPLSAVEIISSTLDQAYKKVSNNTIVEYEGKKYKRRFLPLKLTKSGKNVQKWAKFWLLLSANDVVDTVWESQVREIWPSYFLIRTISI